MVTNVPRHNRPSGIPLLTMLLLGSLPAAAQELVPTKPSDQRPLLDNPLAGWGSEYTNWVELSVGGFFAAGSKPTLMQRQQVPAGAFGGIESLHVEQSVGTNGLFTLDGRGIFDNHDYDISLSYTKEKLGYIKAGFSEFREWYDRSGGYFPPTHLYLTPFARDVGIDRGDAWFEIGLRKPDIPELTFRYDHQFRSGDKDSTSWGDINTSPTGRPRSIVPSFYGIDEQRDIFQFDVKHTIGSTELDGGVRYELIRQDDHTYILRQPGRPAQRYVTQNDGVDSDVFNAHASSATQLSERLLLTTGYAFTMMDADMYGSRIYGAGFDAVYDPTFRRQVFDEGFLDLTGSGTFHEHLFNAALCYTPCANVSIIPALKIAKQDESADSAFIATSVEPPGTATSDPTAGMNDRDYLEVSESLEARYTGLTNWLFYARGEWSSDQGRLTQSELDLLTGDSDLLNEDADRFTQKYIAGANWYPLSRLNLSAQYYHKIRNANFENRLGPPPTAYPGFIQAQDFDTDDANVRLTFRPLNQLTLVTRYDFQLSTIHMNGDSLGDIQAAEVTSHILSESVSWTPIARLYLQGSVNYVLDQTHTPASDLTGAAAHLVLNSRNDYWDVNAVVGLALDEKTDLQAQYLYYRANNYQNNAAFGQPYGAGDAEHGITATLARSLTRSIRWTVKYGFFTNHDQTYGGHQNYNAYLVYSSLQYRF